MLILTRLKDEFIVINDEIRVYFLGMNGRYQCRLGIDASPDVEIHRAEVYEQIQARNLKLAYNQVFNEYEHE